MNINGIKPKKIYLFSNGSNNKIIKIIASNVLEAKSIAKRIEPNACFVSIMLKYV